MVFKLYSITKFLQKLARISKMVYNYIRIVVIEMRRLFKIIIVLIIYFVCFSYFNIVNAAPTEGTDGTGENGGNETIDVKTKDTRNGLQWSNKSLDFWKPSSVKVGEDEISKRANAIVTAIRNTGLILAVIALMVIGFKEITASIEEKTIIKQALPGYLIGVIMVVAITSLPSFIYTLTKELR